jgi:hypothetical protein
MGVLTIELHRQTIGLHIYSFTSLEKRTGDVRFCNIGVGTTLSSQYIVAPSRECTIIRECKFENQNANLFWKNAIEWTLILLLEF